MKIRMATLLIAAGLAAAASTAAIAAKESPLPPPPASGTSLPSGQCIRSHDIRNHSIGDPKSLLVRMNNNDVYRFTMAGNCLAGAISSDPIVTREPPGASIICRPIDIDLAISRGGFENRCIVDSIVKMTPEQVAALPKKLRP